MLRQLINAINGFRLRCKKQHIKRLEKDLRHTIDMEAEIRNEITTQRIKLHSIERLWTNNSKH